MGGFICFSWQAFEEGNAIPHDKINLGLHEFSHALRFSGARGHPKDYFFEHYFERWLACAYSEFRKLKDNIPGSIFRKYGSVNIEEFFSVSVETFFETPAEFKAALPELYLQTSILLNQTFSEDGTVLVDCREALMNSSEVKLTGDYKDAMRFKMAYNKPAIASGALLLIGIVSMIRNGFLYPLPYAFLGAALIVWLYFEGQYVRAFFGKEQLKISKGYFILKHWKTFSMPYSRLISVKSDTDQASLVYYRDGDFYKENLYITKAKPAFDGLCEELKRNGIFVVVKA